MWLIVKALDSIYIKREGKEGRKDERKEGRKESKEGGREGGKKEEGGKEEEIKSNDVDFYCL